MISKEEAKVKLKKAGYNASVDGSVLTILIEQGKSVKNTVKDLKEIFAKIDYGMSFAVKQSSQVSDFDEDAPGDIDEETDIEDSADEDKVLDEVEESDNKEEEFFDEEDDLEAVDGKIKLDDYDMDMILNESSVQFSLEDFGMM